MTQRRIYRIVAPSVDEINFVLGQIADRLDQMEGFRGTPEFKSNVNFGGNEGTNAAEASAVSSLPTKAQVQIMLEDLWPVGSIFFSIVSTNPNTLIGIGTWAIVGTGQLHIGTGTGGAGLVGSYDTDNENILEPRTLIYIWQRTA